MTSPGQVSVKRQDISASATTQSDFIFLALKGSLVKVKLSDGNTLEGVLSSLDSKTGRGTLTMVCEWPAGQTSDLQEHATRDFAMKELVLLTSEPVNFAELTGMGSGGSFATDADISKGSASGHGRELARWDASVVGKDLEASFEGLEDDSLPPGCTQWNQFETNEKLFGVVTSFDESAYTTEIDKNSAEYKKLTHDAERLAREIEGRISSNPHLAEERGAVLDDSQMDEEDRYGAVIRPSKPALPDHSPPHTTAPVSYRHAAVMNIRNQTANVVKMPPVCTSSSPTSSTTQPAPSHGPFKSEATQQPRRSIVNTQVDPEALEGALEEVESSSQTIHRRLSQVVDSDPQLASALQNQHRREVFEKHRKDTAQQFKAFSDQLSSKLSVSSNEAVGFSPGLSSSESSVAGKLNPNATEFIPTFAEESSPAPFVPSGFNPYAMGYTPMQMPMASHDVFYGRPYQQQHPYDAQPMRPMPLYYNPYSYAGPTQGMMHADPHQPPPFYPAMGPKANQNRPLQEEQAQQRQ